MLRLGYLSLVVAAISLCVPLFFPKPAHACSCAVETEITQQERAERAFSQAAAVFAGEVIRVQNPSSPVFDSTKPVTVTFDVSKTWKGSRTGTLEVTTPNSSAGCGYDFRDGKEYLVYAPKNMEVWLCGETKLLSEAAPDLEALGSPEVLPNTSGIVASAPGSHVAPLLAGLTLAVLTLGFVYVGVTLRRRQSISGGNQKPFLRRGCNSCREPGEQEPPLRIWSKLVGRGRSGE